LPHGLIDLVAVFPLVWGSTVTAAHRSLPFGTRCTVTHGGRSVVITIQAQIGQILADALDATQTFRRECCFATWPSDSHQLASLND
jgi:hypothetical protein